MASLNQLTSEIAHSIGQPNNHAVRENIKSSIIHTRNELIRHSYTQHGYSDRVLNYRYKVSLVDIKDGDVELPDNLNILIENIKRTEQKVPRPVRLTNNLPFMRISSVGYKTNTEFPFVKETSARFTSALPGMGGLPCYDYINDYVYLFNLKGKFIDLNKMIIEAPFENPSLVEKLNGDAGEFSELYGDDNEWFLPEDMVGQIKDILLKRENLQQIRETNEVDGYHQTK
uniref:Structural protein n=1 Tax=Geladintestivirus 1 TaxID=3233133 RepID=A0AAU8MHH1_9CAUD